MLKRESTMTCLARSKTKPKASMTSIQTKYSSSSLETEGSRRYLLKHLVDRWVKWEVIDVVAEDKTRWLR